MDYTTLTQEQLIAELNQRDTGLAQLQALADEKTAEVTSLENAVEQLKTPKTILETIAQLNKEDKQTIAKLFRTSVYGVKCSMALNYGK